MRTIKYVCLLAALLALVDLNGPAPAQAHHRVVVHIAPPAPRVVVAVRPHCPYREGVWVAGNWEWHHGKHLWIEGRWIRGKRGQVWIDGRWVETPGGREWIPGHWQRV
jgi:hypothetical protein